eukprot:2832315-Rhodomonas_salina.2
MYPLICAPNVSAYMRLTRLRSHVPYASPLTCAVPATCGGRCPSPVRHAPTALTYYTILQPVQYKHTVCAYGVCGTCHLWWYVTSNMTSFPEGSGFSRCRLIPATVAAEHVYPNHYRP